MGFGGGVKNSSISKNRMILLYGIFTKIFSK